LQLIAQAASTGDDDASPITIPVSNSTQVPSTIRSPPASHTAPNDTPESSVRPDIRVCCLQLDDRHDDETPYDAAQRALACLTSIAESEEDIDLFVLPEVSVFGSNKEAFTKYLPVSPPLQQMCRHIDDLFSLQAQELGVFLVYGMIGWSQHESNGGLRFTLQYKVVNRQGSVVAIHNKCHLNDTELQFIQAGTRKAAATFSIDGFHFGLLVGDDLKCPNMAQNLVREQGVDVLIHPAGAETIPTYMKRCRAVENAVYLLGVEDTYGSTMVVPPDPEHEPVCVEKCEKAEGEAYVLTRIERAALDYARTNFTYYRVMNDTA
jgi:predicted amidohydrolase